jgi:hypothetical protein
MIIIIGNAGDQARAAGPHLTIKILFRVAAIWMDRNLGKDFEASADHPNGIAEVLFGDAQHFFGHVRPSAAKSC